MRRRCAPLLGFPQVMYLVLESSLLPKHRGELLSSRHQRELSPTRDPNSAQNQTSTVLSLSQVPDSFRFLGFIFILFVKFELTATFR